MSKKILGLDIGNDTVKIVQVTRALKQDIRITGWDVVDLRQSGSLYQGLQRVFADPAFRGGTVVMSLPAKNFFFRNVRLPFTEKGKIAQTLPFEIEPLIPHPVDDVLIDFLIVSQAAESDIFAAVIPKSVARDRMELITASDASLAAVDVEAMPLASRLIKAGIPTGFHLLLDVGARHSVGVFFRNGKFFQIRSYAFGGDRITETLAETLKIPLPDAEARKRRGELHGAEKEISQACRRFFDELRNTLQSLKMMGNFEEELTRASLTGGGALCSRLHEEMGRYFGVPVDFVDLASMENIALAGERDRWNPLLMNEALALAIRPSRGATGFNFKGTDFTFKLSWTDLQKEVKWAAIGAGLLFALAAADVGADYFADRTRLGNIQKDIQSIFHRCCPEVTSVVDPAAQMKTKMTEIRKFAALARGLGGQADVLTVLRDISERVPASYPFQILSFSFDGESIRFRGETDNFETADKIKKELGGSEFLRNVAMTSSSLTRAGNRVEFEMKATLAKPI
ncbi:MAG: pilus assembly protein PilM [Syntrophales bacterium]